MRRSVGKIPIAVARGDGIGPEIMNATLKIFTAANVPFDYKFVDMGKQVYLGLNGLPKRTDGMTPEAKEAVETRGILFKGPMETPKGTGAKSVNVTARKVWNTYSNKRVFKTLPGVDTVFSKAGLNIDITLIRENIEDTYGGIEYMQTHDVAKCYRLISRPGSIQVHQKAFQIAENCNAHRLTCCHKANIMKITDGLFLDTFYQVGKDYPNIKTDDIIVDDLAMKLVMNPTKFNCISLPNLQGDIISDLCAGLVGGLGMAPSANIGDQISIFEAVHGTAPDIAGKNIGNPTALLLSGLMMLRHLGLNDKAELIQTGLESALKNGFRTRDLAQLIGKEGLSTDAFADAIIHHFPTRIDHKTVSFSDIKYKPPMKPTENVIHITKRAPTNEVTVGVDVFVDTDLQAKAIATLVEAQIKDSKVKLVMISNRGTQVWPTGSLFTECVNHYRFRLESKDGKHIKETELLKIVSGISEKLRVVCCDMLLKIDGKPGYSLAQGQ